MVELTTLLCQTKKFNADFFQESLTDKYLCHDYNSTQNRIKNQSINEKYPYVSGQKLNLWLSCVGRCAGKQD